MEKNDIHLQDFSVWRGNGSSYGMESSPCTKKLKKKKKRDIQRFKKGKKK